MKQKNPLGSWAPQKKNSDLEPSELLGANRTLWIVLGGAVVLTLILAVSFFTFAHFFPSFFFIGTDKSAAVMDKQEVTMDEMKYYLTLAAGTPTEETKSGDYWKDKSRANEVKKLALLYAQAIRLYETMAQDNHLTVSDEVMKQTNDQLADLEQRKDTPLFQYELKSNCLTEELWKSLIVADGYRRTLEEYLTTTTNPATLEQRARDLFTSSYLKIKWIRFSFLDGAGKPLSEEAQDQLRTKSYEVYQTLKSGEDFQAMQNKLTGEEHILTYDQLVSHGQLTEALEDLAFSLKLDEISSPLETAQGIFILQRVDAKEDFSTQEVAMVTLARQQLFSEWVDTYRKQHPIRPYRSNLKKLDLVTFFPSFYQQKEEADKQISWMEKSK